LQKIKFNTIVIIYINKGDIFFCNFQLQRAIIIDILSENMLLLIESESLPVTVTITVLSSIICTRRINLHSRARHRHTYVPNNYFLHLFHRKNTQVSHIKKFILMLLSLAEAYHYFLLSLLLERASHFYQRIATDFLLNRNRYYLLI